MMIRLLDDPGRDPEELLRTFTDGFYGPAGAGVREYLDLLEAAARRRPSPIGMGSGALSARDLDLRFRRDAEALFDRAEGTVAGDPVLLRRLRRARFPLDGTAVRLYPRLARERHLGGERPEERPPDRDAMALPG